MVVWYAIAVDKLERKVEKHGDRYKVELNANDKKHDEILVYVQLYCTRLT